MIQKFENHIKPQKLLEQRVISESWLSVVVSVLDLFSHAYRPRVRIRYHSGDHALISALKSFG